MHFLFEQVGNQIVLVVDLANGADCKSTEVRIDEQWLCIGIGDDTNARVATKLVQLVFELRAEVRVGDIVNASFEAVLLVEGCHTRTACTEVGMVVGAVEDIGDATCC